ncbi:MAG: UDP-N-acetylmuramoyl-L-alanyl-D-glutamate--2,6-diaminopimelate ligase [Elusimicrobiota bacterium]
MKLKYLLDGTDIDLNGFEDIEIKGLARNSEKIKPGYLFLASKGSKIDAKQFIPEAEKAKAAAALTDDLVKNHTIPCFFAKNFEKTVSLISRTFYSDPSASLYCVGITGTKGKTTVSYLLEKSFKDFSLKPSVIGTVNYRTWKKVIMQAPNTTPAEPLLCETLYAFINQGCSSCILEVSSHALALGRVDNVSFDAAVFTNLQSDHLDFHKTREEYFLAKKKLFEKLSESQKKNKLAVINGDDPVATDLSRECKAGVRKVLYGFSPSCDYQAINLKETPLATSFDMKNPKGTVHSFSIKLIGRHNVYNFLAAAALLLEKGFTVQSIKDSLENFSSIPGRLEKIESSKGFFVFVDYAHTEESLKSAISALRKSCQARIITVFGCGGDRDRTKRAPMGWAACEMSDIAIITSDNPRTENPSEIIEEIESGVKGHFSNYFKIPDRAEAIREAVRLAGKGDFVLIAGKGHETYQITAEGKIHFDDRQQAKIAMKELGKL